MRVLLLSVLNQTAGRRGGDLRNLDLRMFMVHALPDVRPVACSVVGASLRTVKEDNTYEDKEHLLGWMRSRDRLGCPVGVLAGYLEWLNRAPGQGFLEVMSEDLRTGAGAAGAAGGGSTGAGAGASEYKPKWWHLSLLGGRRADVAISSTTHMKLTHAAFDSGGIGGKRSVTHIHRPTALGGLLEGGVMSTDAALYQGWVHGVWADTYAKASFKTLPMLKAHGWDARLDSFECWWEGAEADIPGELLAAVFPGLDALTVVAERRWVLMKDDRSAVEFLRVLRMLRRVFIEDSVTNYAKYPEWPPYVACPVFEYGGRLRALWEAYARDEARRCVQREQEWRLRQHDPALANALIEQLHAAQQTQRDLTEALRGLKIGGGGGGGGIGGGGGGVVVGGGGGEQDRNMQEILPPELKEPHVSDLTVTYKRWIEPGQAGGICARDAYAAYLEEHKRIAWTKIFDKSCANAAKVRYYRMLPFLSYVDQAKDAGVVLRELQAIMTEHKIDGPKFIKNSFYALATKSNISTPLSIEEFEGLMRARGLELPV